MNIKITSYQFNTKAIIIISAIASLIGLIVSFLSPSLSYIGMSMTFGIILIIWLPALMLIMMDKLHRKRSITITDDEIIGVKSLRTSAKELVFGGWIDNVIIKRSEITNFGKDFQTVVLNLAASHNNIIIKTEKNEYVVDGRIFDCKVVGLALAGKFQDASELFEKKCKRKSRFYTWFIAIVDIALLLFFSIL